MALTDTTVRTLKPDTGKSEKLVADVRGLHTAWVNGVRAGLQIKSGDDGTAELSLLKPNYTKRGIKVALRWTPDGVLVAEEQATGMVASIQENNDDKLVLRRWREDFERMDLR